MPPMGAVGYGSLGTNLLIMRDGVLCHKSIVELVRTIIYICHLVLSPIASDDGMWYNFGVFKGKV